MSDILYDARERILAENQSILPTTPKDLKQTYETQAAWAGFFAGAVAGGTIGAHIGLALGPLGAIAGTIPCAIIGGIIGAFGAAKAGAQFNLSQEVFSTEYGRDNSRNPSVTGQSAQRRTVSGTAMHMPVEIKFCANCNPEPRPWQGMHNKRCGNCNKRLYFVCR